MLIIAPPQSGSVAAQTSSRNRSGQYIRSRANPVQPRTPAQVAARARFTTCSSAWRGLTAAQQAAWQAFAASFTTVNRIGTTINLTGTQCFVKVNCVNLLLGRAIVDIPPALPTFVACSMTGLTAVAATPAITLTGTAPATGTSNMVFASPQESAGVSFNGKYAYLSDVGSSGTVPYEFHAIYAAKYGALISGKKIFVKVVQEQAGMQDNGTLYSVVVT